VQKESGIDGQQSRQLDEFALHWASGTGHLALGIWHWASGTGHLALGICKLQPTTASLPMLPGSWSRCWIS